MPQVKTSENRGPQVEYGPGAAVVCVCVCVVRHRFETVETELDAQLELRQLAGAASTSPKKRSVSRRLCGALREKVTETGAPAQAEANQHGRLRWTERDTRTKTRG